MLTYATTDDLVIAYPDLDPDLTDAAISQALTVASRLVRRATLTAIYDVDTTGKPSDPEVLAAFNAATCAQAYALLTAGITTASAGAAGFTGGTVSSSIGSATVTRTQRAGADADKVTALTALTDQAHGFLADLPRAVFTW